MLFAPYMLSAGIGVFHMEIGKRGLTRAAAMLLS